VTKYKIKNYILFTIPAVWITKESPVSDKVRKMIEDATGECVGRCYWRDDQVFLATSEQFGDLVAELMQLPELDLTKMQGKVSRYIKVTTAVEEDFHSE
jgi:hypothetical protein